MELKKSFLFSGGVIALQQQQQPSQGRLSILSLAPAAVYIAFNSRVNPGTRDRQSRGQIILSRNETYTTALIGFSLFFFFLFHYYTSFVYCFVFSRRR